MTKGVGGVSAAEAMGQLVDMTQDIERIGVEEFQARLGRLQELMKQQDVGAIYLRAQ